MELKSPSLLPVRGLLSWQCFALLEYFLRQRIDKTEDRKGRKEGVKLYETHNTQILCIGKGNSFDDRQCHYSNKRFGDSTRRLVDNQFTFLSHIGKKIEKSSRLHSRKWIRCLCWKEKKAQEIDILFLTYDSSSFLLTTWSGPIVSIMKSVGMVSIVSKAKLRGKEIDGYNSAAE